jgi:hypothetical protein
VEELTWRPGFIQRAVSSLPVRFAALPEPAPEPVAPAPPPLPFDVEAPAPQQPTRWWQRLANWWSGGNS